MRYSVVSGSAPSQQAPGLGYYIEWSEVWNTVSGKFGWDFMQDCQKVYQRMDYNASKFNAVWWKSTYSFEAVRTVINTYRNLCISGAIPEYVDPDRDGSQTNNKKQIIAAVAKASGQTEVFVALTMYELYYATKDGSLTTTCWLQPRTCKDLATYRDQVSQDAGGYQADLFSTLKWIGIIAAIGIGAYLVLPMLVRR